MNFDCGANCAAIGYLGASGAGGWKSESMVRRYAHMSVRHLQPYADQLILPDTDPLINPVTDTKKSNCPEKLESSGHKNGHSESRLRLKLVAGLDVTS